MAGGLFGQKFSVNVKCIIFSLIIISLFLYKHNIKSTILLYSIIGLLFIGSYVLMAWYDYMFGCSILPLKKGEYSIQKYIKPPAHEPKKQIDGVLSEDNNNEDNNNERKLHLYLIYFSHILFIVPLLCYITIKKTKIDLNIYPLIGALAGLTFLYHGYGILNLVL